VILAHHLSAMLNLFYFGTLELNALDERFFLNADTNNDLIWCRGMARRMMMMMM
jgi:hypothetical protein